MVSKTTTLLQIATYPISLHENTFLILPDPKSTYHILHSHLCLFTWHKLVFCVQGGAWLLSELACQGTGCVQSFHFHFSRKYQSLSYTWKNIMISHHFISRGTRPQNKCLDPGPSGPCQSNVGFLYFYAFITSIIKHNFLLKTNHPSSLCLFNIKCKQTTEKKSSRIQYKTACKYKHNWPQLNNKALLWVTLIFFYFNKQISSIYTLVIKTWWSAWLMIWQRFIFSHTLVRHCYDIGEIAGCVNQIKIRVWLNIALSVPKCIAWCNYVTALINPPALIL